MPTSLPRHILARAARAPPSREQVRAELARRSLAEFVKQAWAVIFPGNNFSGGGTSRHLRPLQAVTEGKTRRLAISLPPNTLKSFIVSICCPRGSGPRTRPSVLVAANDGRWRRAGHAVARGIGLVHAALPHEGRVRGGMGAGPDQDEKTWYATTKGGHRIRYSVTRGWSQSA